MIATGTASKVQEYIDSVSNGDIVVCELVRLAVQRHVDDLARQRTKQFPYYFNESHAGVACDFFPLMLRHSIGDFAGLPFDLEPWQSFAMWSLFGWKREQDDSRRFRKFYWSMARKNGKSSIAAGIALYLAMLDVNPITGKPEDVAEVVLSATKKEQVEKVIYAEIERMRLRSPAIAKISSRINKQITFKHNSGSIRCVGSDKPYDGLNPHAVLMDELHAWKEHHRKFYDTMQTGSGYRRQPMIGTVTTAGDDQSHLWKDEYRYSEGILRGDIVDESVFAYVFELDEKDDPLDESVWIKSNPNLGVSVKLDFLRQTAAPATQSKLALNRFIRYHGNRIVSSTESAFDLGIWDSCEAELTDWLHADALGAGVDLGGRDDLAAYGIVARFYIGEDDDGREIWRYEGRIKAYIAEDTSRDLSKQPFANWCHDGLIVKCKHPIARLTEDLINDCADLGISTVAYDPYNAQQLGEALEAEGITAARMAQNYSMFSEPIHDLQACIHSQRFNHDGNPVLRWAARNAVAVSDKQGRIMYDKSSSNEKIDPIVALTMGHRICMLAASKASGSLYL